MYSSLAIYERYETSQSISLTLSANRSLFNFTHSHFYTLTTTLLSFPTFSNNPYLRSTLIPTLKHRELFISVAFTKWSSSATRQRIVSRYATEVKASRGFRESTRKSENETTAPGRGIISVAPVDDTAQRANVHQEARLTYPWTQRWL